MNIFFHFSFSLVSAPCVLCLIPIFLFGSVPGRAQEQPEQRLLTAADILKLPVSKPNARIAYGRAAQQFGELRLPKGAGDRPLAVVIVIHGGCWLRRFASLNIMDPLATELTRLGVATWNIEYRTLDDPGGAWPGMFRDVGAAVNHLRKLARKHRLDLERVVVLGHSSGGHLALWAAARHRLPRNSALWAKNPVRIRGAVSLDGIEDLEWMIQNPGRICGADTLRRLLGERPEESVKWASPAALLPLGAPQALIFPQGALTQRRQLYAERARAAGDRVEVTPLAESGHFEFLAPRSRAWGAVARAVFALLE